MSVLALLLSIIALIVAILAYKKVGGVTDVRQQTESLREKTADALNTIEAALRTRETKPGKKKEEG